MLNKGSIAYPYQPYNSKAHITNYEADYLKSEAERSCNFWYKGNVAFGGEYTEIFKKCKKGIHTLRISSTRNTSYGEFHWYIRDLTTDTLILDGILPNNSYTLNVTQEMIDHDVRMWSWGTTSSDVCKAMLNEGSEPLPYQPYEGKVVHEKQIENITPGIFSLVGNNVDTLTISKNETYFIVSVAVNPIYVEGNVGISFIGSSLVTTVGMLSGEPKICLNGSAYTLDNNSVTLKTSGLMKVYKVNY